MGSLLGMYKAKVKSSPRVFGSWKIALTHRPGGQVFAGRIKRGDRSVCKEFGCPGCRSRYLWDEGVFFLVPEERAGSKRRLKKIITTPERLNRLQNSAMCVLRGLAAQIPRGLPDPWIFPIEYLPLWCEAINGKLLGHPALVEKEQRPEKPATPR